MKISVLKQPDVFVREEIDDLKETGGYKPGALGRKRYCRELTSLSRLLPAAHHD